MIFPLAPIDEVKPPRCARSPSASIPHPGRRLTGGPGLAAGYLRCSILLNSVLTPPYSVGGYYEAFDCQRPSSGQFPASPKLPRWIGQRWTNRHPRTASIVLAKILMSPTRTRPSLLPTPSSDAGSWDFLGDRSPRPTFCISDLA